MIDIIAIDGPSGVGKSTVARRVALALGLGYVDTGAIYRAIAWNAIKNKIDLSDETNLYEKSNNIQITVTPLDQFAKQQIFIHDTEITLAIRTPAVTDATSIISKLPRIRALAVSLQKKLANQSKNGAVLEGRDIGTVVFPDAKLKIYLDASPEVRANRRMLELKQQGYSTNLKTILDQISVRDERDSNREHSPLKPADDAVTILTDGLSIEDVVNRILMLYQSRTEKQHE